MAYNVTNARAGVHAAALQHHAHPASELWVLGGRV
jgi:hypothetical protein